MPYQPQVSTLQTNIIAAGGTVTGAELDALDALILTLNAGGVTAKIKELHFPVGNGATAARERLIFLGSAHTSPALASFSNVVGAQGQVASGAVAVTDFDYPNFSMGVMLNSGFSPGSFSVILGGNSTDFNFFSYDWAASGLKYNGLCAGYSILFGPNSTPLNNNGDTMLWNPSYDGFLAASGGASEHFFTRDGEVIFRRNVIMNAGSMGAGDPVYLPFTSAASWHASFLGQYLTRSEMAVLCNAIRACAITLGRSVLPMKSVRAMFMGDSRTYSTQVNALPYPNPFYRQTAAAFGWGSTAEVWDGGISGRSILQINSGTSEYLDEKLWLVNARNSGPRIGRIAFFWLAANDLLTGASAATTKSRFDTCIAAVRAAGWCPIILSEPTAYLNTAADAAGFNALLGADITALTDGTKAFGLFRIDQVPRLVCSDLGASGMAVSTPVAPTVDITVPLNHGWLFDDEAEFTALVGGAGLALATTYYVKASTSGTIQLAATPGGAAISVTSVMNGKLARSRQCTSGAGTTITMARPHGWLDGYEVRFERKTGGSGFALATRYYVTVLTATTVTLSLTLGGPAVAAGTPLTAPSVLMLEATTFDGVHFTELGYEKIAAGAYTTAQPMLALPTGVAVGAQTANTAASYSLQIQVAPSPQSIGPYSYSAINLPAGITINASTGLISGTPTATGVFNVVVSITNDNGAGTVPFTLTVSGVPPVVTSGTSAFGNVRSPFEWQITAASSPTSFSASPLPDGLSIDTGTGLISGTPTIDGVTVVHVTATNAYGTSPVQDLTISIGLSIGYNPYPPNPAIPIWNQPLAVPEPT